MSSVNKVLFVIGAGGNVGRSLATKFASEGYKVALAARSVPDSVSSEGYLNVQLDVGKPETIGAAFDKVEKHFGPPSVVAYNAAALVANSDPLAVLLSDLQSTLNTNIASVHVAAQHAVASLDKLGPAGLTFILTGNACNTSTFRMPSLMTLSIGKSANALMIELAAQVWGAKGARFYYADERTETGAPVGNKVNGEAHAQMYWDLAQSKEQGDPLVTFVKGKGIVKF
ncbi:putative short chain type dehydrogenase [Pseudohyphozyma bogoriensis]|nr:putative short chain type dehydrogenase [Pseudohyphozyma bogoriensis]